MWNPLIRFSSKCTVSLSHFPVVFRSFTWITRLIVQLTRQVVAPFPPLNVNASTAASMHNPIFLYIFIMTTIICREFVWWWWLLYSVADVDDLLLTSWWQQVARSIHRRQLCRPLVELARADHRFLEWPRKNASHDSRQPYPIEIRFSMLELKLMIRSDLVEVHHLKFIVCF